MSDLKISDKEQLESMGFVLAEIKKPSDSSFGKNDVSLFYFVHPSGLVVQQQTSESAPHKIINPYAMILVSDNPLILKEGAENVFNELSAVSNVSGEVLCFLKCVDRMKSVEVCGLRIKSLQKLIEKIEEQKYFSFDELKKRPSLLFDTQKSKADWISEISEKVFNGGACRMSRDYLALGWKSPNEEIKERYAAWYQEFMINFEHSKSINDAKKKFEHKNGLPFEAWALRFVNHANSENACWLLYDIKEKSAQEKKELFDYVFPNGQSFAHAFLEWLSITLMKINGQLSEVYAEDLRELLQSMDVSDIKLDSNTFKPLEQLVASSSIVGWKYSGYDFTAFDSKVWNLLYEFKIEMKLPENHEELLDISSSYFDDSFHIYLKYLGDLKRENELKNNVKAVNQPEVLKIKKPSPYRF